MIENGREKSCMKRLSRQCNQAHLCTSSSTMIVAIFHRAGLRQRRYAVVYYSSLSIDLERRCIECALFVPERSFSLRHLTSGLTTVHCPVALVMSSTVQCAQSQLLTFNQVTLLVFYNLILKILPVMGKCEIV